MVPKSMSSEVENIEIKRKNNTDKLNLSGQIRPVAYKLLIFNPLQATGQRAGQIQFVRVSILT